jgi:hypothetical protein
MFVIVLALAACAPKTTVRKEPVVVEKVRPELPSAFVIKEKINVRQHGTTASGIIATINDGDEIFIMENEDGWYQIKFGDNQSGWVRSDLVGPRNLSRTILAKAFVDSMLPDYNTDMFFDNEALYRIVYLVLPKDAYSSKAKAAALARKVGHRYQKKVYPGDLEIRIMRPDDQKELFMKVHLEAVNIADVPVPVLEYGRLYAMETPVMGSVRLWILIPEDIPDDPLLEMARSISAKYAYPFTKAEIYLVKDTKAGHAYLKNPQKSPVGETVLRLYYLEDKDGEYFQFDVSGNLPSAD